MNDNLLIVNKNDIIGIFNVENQKYCAIKNEDSVVFGLITELDDNNKVITSVSNKVIDKVIEEYEKYVDFFESKDELDIIEGDEL